MWTENLCIQVYETQTELTEAREELELLKLKLDVADQEAQAAKRQAAEATAATAALLQLHDSPGMLSPVNRRSLSREACFLLSMLHSCRSSQLALRQQCMMWVDIAEVSVELLCKAEKMGQTKVIVAHGCKHTSVGVMR